jgi:hypothetical protein
MSKVLCMHEVKSNYNKSQIIFTIRQLKLIDYVRQFCTYDLREIILVPFFDNFLNNSRMCLLHSYSLLFWFTCQYLYSRDLKDI